MSNPESDTTVELTSTVYILPPELSRQMGLPQTYLKKLADAGQIPFLDSGRHRHFNVEDVAYALSRIAHDRMQKPAPETPLDFAEFSTRAAKVLKLLKVDTWEQLAALPKEQLWGAPNVGCVTLREVQTKLASRQQQGSLWAEPASNPTPVETVEPTYDGDAS